MKRVLVTGATGFVGSNLVRRLIGDGHEVHVFLRSDHNSSRINSILDDLQLHEVNIQFKDSVVKAVSQICPDWIFHLAVHGAYPFQTDLDRMISTNFLGTVNLIQACTRCGFDSFINTGSSSEYGFKKHAPSEDEWLEPNSYYAVTKASSTLFCRYTAISQNMNITTLRLYSAYGPYEEPSRLIPTLILEGLKGEFPPLVSPDIARDFIYIDDVISAYLLTASSHAPEIGAVYNVGTGKQTTIREVVDVVGQMFLIEAEPIWDSMPHRQWDTQSWVANIEKIINHLGWTPRFTIEDGIKQMLNILDNDPDLQKFYDIYNPI